MTLSIITFCCRYSMAPTTAYAYVEEQY